MHAISKTTTSAYGPCCSNGISAQRAKKVVSDSRGLVDFAIGQVSSVLNLPDGQVKYFEEFNLQNLRTVKSILAHQKIWGAS